MIFKGSERIRFLTTINTCMKKRLFNIQIRKLFPDGTLKEVKCSSIKVGDIIKVNHGERVPVDMILVQSTDKTGGTFLKTD